MLDHRKSPHRFRTERLSARWEAAGERYSYSEGDIRRLNGVNSTDKTIRDTLLEKYRIEVSDIELLEFSNYLVKLDPAYPLWSKQIFVKDYSRINSDRMPRQTHIMTNPNRVHQSYPAFKKQTNQTAPEAVIPVTLPIPI